MRCDAEVPGQRLGDEAWVLVDGTEFGNLGCSVREAIVSKAWASCSKRSRSNGDMREAPAKAIS